MRTFNDTNILNLIEQIREVNHLIDLHKLSDDDFMLNQYQARKKDFIKELVYELILLDVNTIDLFQFIRKKINQIETFTPKVESSSVNKQLHFSIKELETITRL